MVNGRGGLCTACAGKNSDQCELGHWWLDLIMPAKVLRIPQCARQCPLRQSHLFCSWRWTLNKGRYRSNCKYSYTSTQSPCLLRSITPCNFLAISTVHGRSPPLQLATKGRWVTDVSYMENALFGQKYSTLRPHAYLHETTPPPCIPARVRPLSHA